MSLLSLKVAGVGRGGGTCSIVMHLRKNVLGECRAFRECVSKLNAVASVQSCVVCRYLALHKTHTISTLHVPALKVFLTAVSSDAKQFPCGPLTVSLYECYRFLFA